MFETHKVFNQPPEFAGFNAYTSDPVLVHLTSGLPDDVRRGLVTHGKWAGHSETFRLAKLANTKLPELHTHDAQGNRLDQVEFHPAYHALMRKSCSVGLHGSIWQEGETEKGLRNLSRASRFFISSQVESGHLCPITMTNASVAALMGSPDVLKEWMPGILSNKYDPTHRAPAKKDGLTIGMGMTEKQGGSDVRAATTVATADNNKLWRITGHKWFFSAPMCDAFLVLAQMDEGLGCFLIPRILPDGSDNGLRIQRLKDKLGNRSNASSEVEFYQSLGHLVGEPGRGVSAIMEMVTLTRLDCVLSSAAIMRTCLAEAVHHTRHRTAFGSPLIDQPIMERVLADMALDVAAATALSFRLAASFDRASANPAEAAYARLMVPAIKYWVCKITPQLVNEAMECLGGNGYVETGNLARHYREAPLNAIWEGAGNIMCLDVLRVVSKSSEILNTVLGTLERDLASASAKKTIEVIRTAADMASRDPGSARILTEQLAFTAAAAELSSLGLPEIASAFIESRLGGLWRNTYGMLDNRHSAKQLLEKTYPAW